MDNGPAHRTAEARGSAKLNKKTRLKWIIMWTVVAALVIVGAVVWLYQSSARAYIDTGKYQAVFFTNGQVYFGRLQKLGGNYFRLTDIFYIQAKQTDTNNPQETSTEQTADIQLIKLGNEVHGPEDEMIINQDQILFFENLKDDGKVSASIDKYNSTEKK